MFNSSSDCNDFGQREVLSELHNSLKHKKRAGIPSLNVVELIAQLLLSTMPGQYDGGQRV